MDILEPLSRLARHHPYTRIGAFLHLPVFLRYGLDSATGLDRR